MEEMGINLSAILVAVVANFILGFIWYTPLFGNAWAKEMGFDKSVKPTGGQMAKGMILMVIGNFFMAYVFAHNIAAWGYVPGVKEMSPMANISNAAVFTWLGFYVPVVLSAVGWENRSWKLFFINAGYHLVSLFLVAAILMFM